MAANWWYDSPVDGATQQNPYSEKEFNEFTFKCLLPKAIIGAIIGKKGATINRIKKDSGCVVLEMSKVDKGNPFAGFYPNTNR